MLCVLFFVFCVLIFFLQSFFVEIYSDEGAAPDFALFASYHRCGVYFHYIRKIRGRLSNLLKTHEQLALAFPGREVLVIFFFWRFLCLFCVGIRWGVFVLCFSRAALLYLSWKGQEIGAFVSFFSTFGKFYIYILVLFGQKMRCFVLC